MITAKDLRWGGYQQYEGWWHPGTCKYSLPVVTQTEGGTLDAGNFYDSCLASLGLIQYCEKFYLVSDLLGAMVAKLGPDVLIPLSDALSASNAMFALNAKKRWRFHFRDQLGEVDTPQEQHLLFFKGASGLKGSWGPEGSPEREHAKLWATGLINTFAQPATFAVQSAFTVPRIKGFAMAEAKAILWGPGDPSDETLGWVGGLRAAYLSFAANNPTIAQNHLKIAVAATADGLVGAKTRSALVGEYLRRV